MPSTEHRTRNIDKAAITQWLKGPSFREIHLTALAQRTPGTVTWFIQSDEFARFVQEKYVIIWATGMPGSGKTVLVSVSIYDLQHRFSGREDVAVVYAYLRYSERRSYPDILASLLSQLVESHWEVAYPHIAPLYEHHLKTGDNITELELESALRSVCSALEKVFVVVDGLDEVDDEIKEALLQTLPSLGVSLLIVSRPLDLFTCYTPDAIFLSIQARTEDIGLLVLDKINKSARLKAILRGNAGLIDRLSSRIKEKSKGMFLVASLQMELLRTSSSVNSLFKALEALPSGVNEMYRRTMERIEAQSEEDVSIARRIFLWILHAYETITVEMLQQALTFSYENLAFDVDDTIPVTVMLSLCCGLVTVEGRNQVRFIHYTTQEFLQTIAFPDLPSPHTLLSVACLVQLTGAKVESWDVSSPSRIAYSADAFPDLTPYAYRNCWNHAKMSDGSGDLHPHIISFLSKCTTYPADIRGAPGRLTGLDLAARFGLVNVINSGEVPYRQSEAYKNYTPIHHAAITGQLDALRALLTSHREIDVFAQAADFRASTALHFAVSSYFQNPELVQDLISLSRNRELAQNPTSLRPSPPVSPAEQTDLAFSPHNIFSVRDNRGRTPLMTACAFSNENMVRLVITCQEAATPLNEKEMATAMYYTCNNPSNGNSIAQFLVSKFPSLDMKAFYPDAAFNAFMDACMHKHEDTIRWFLARDPSLIRRTNSRGATALMQLFHRNSSVGYFSLELLDLLLAAGCDVQAQDDGGRSVFWWAAGHEYGEGADFLIRLLAVEPTIDILQRDKHGITVLMRAAECRSPAKIEFVLSQPCVDAQYINAQDDRGRSAFMRACTSNEPGWLAPWDRRFAVDILLSQPGLDINLRNGHKLTALDLMLATDYTIAAPLQMETIRMLLSHKSLTPATIRKALRHSFTEGSLIAARLMLSAASKLDTGAFCQRLEDQETIILLAHSLRRKSMVHAELLLAHCYGGIENSGWSFTLVTYTCRCPDCVLAGEGRHRSVVRFLPYGQTEWEHRPSADYAVSKSIDYTPKPSTSSGL